MHSRIISKGYGVALQELSFVVECVFGLGRELLKGAKGVEF